MRKSMHIVIFLVMLNASSGLITASGLGTDLGINPQPGAGEQIEHVDESAQNINPSGGGSETLFGLFVSAASQVKDILVMVTVGGPMMLLNLGVPDWLVGFVFAPAYLLVGSDLLYAYTGRDI